MQHAFLTSYNSLFVFSAKQGLLIFRLFLILFNDVYATYYQTYRNGQCVEKNIEKTFSNITSLPSWKKKYNFL